MGPSCVQRVKDFGNLDTVPPEAPSPLKSPFRSIMVLIAALSLGGLLASTACSDTPSRPSQTATPSSESGQVEVLGSIPHADAAWTEGLILEDGLLWESTGNPTGSGVRAIDPDTGDVLWSVSNSNAFFAEGLVHAFGRTYLLSFWEGTVFTFDRDAPEPFQPLAYYEGEGWGLTAVGEALVNSNGTSDLFYRDPDTFALLKTATVLFQGQPVERLNELEYDGRYLWANQWMTAFVYRIDEADPSRVARYTLPPDFCPGGQPNGIAWDQEAGLFYVTGQRCPQILKVRFR